MCVEFPMKIDRPRLSAVTHMGTASLMGNSLVPRISDIDRVRASSCITPKSVTKVTALPPSTLDSSLGNGVGITPE
jgi:hypothetical protein